MNKFYHFIAIIILTAIVFSPITAKADTSIIWSDNFSTKSKITYEVNHNNDQAGYMVYKYDTVNIDNNIVSFTITDINGTQYNLQIDTTSGKIKDSTKESFLMKDISKFSVSSSLSYNIPRYSDRNFQIASKGYIDCIWINNGSNILVSLPVWKLTYDQSNATVIVHDDIFLSQITGTLLYRNYTEALNSGNVLNSEYFRIFNYTGITLVDEHYLQPTINTTIKVGNSPGFEFFSVLIFIPLIFYYNHRKKH